jgi:hypothetical protein
MPYTLPLREVPSFPAAQGQFTDAQGRPTREFYTFLTELRTWMERVQETLAEIEATTFP